MNKTAKLTDFLSGLLILVFTYTVITKLAHLQRFVMALEKSPVFGGNPEFFAALILCVETATTILLFIPAFRQWGFLVATLMMLAFTTYVAWLLWIADKQPCACGGLLENLTWTQHLLFNSSLTLIAFVGWLLSGGAQFFIAINRNSRKPVTE